MPPVSVPTHMSKAPAMAWTANKRARPAGARTEESTPDAGKAVSGILSSIHSMLESAPETPATNLGLGTNAVLQCLTLKQALAETDLSKASAAIPIVTRAYEESFLREPESGDEVPCSMGKSCECMYIDDKQPFVGVQFVLPTIDSDTNLCLMCLRKTTHLLFFHTIRQGKTPPGVIQRYGNICGVENEYHPSAMLICPDGGPVHTMPFPVVAHQRNHYSVYKHNGKHRIRQVGIGMQDFGSAPPPLKP